MQDFTEQKHKEIKKFKNLKMRYESKAREEGELLHNIATAERGRVGYTTVRIQQYDHIHTQSTI